VLAAEHLLRFDGVDLRFERVERLRQIRGDVLTALRPFEQDADVVDLLAQAGFRAALARRGREHRQR
jgi:hypothetical protein